MQRVCQGVCWQGGKGHRGGSFQKDPKSRSLGVPRDNCQQALPLKMTHPSPKPTPPTSPPYPPPT